MKPSAGLMFAVALAGPAAARGLPDALKPSSTGVPASAIAEQGSAGALDALDRGRALLLGNNPAQALSAFQVALAQAPQSVAALNGIAIAYDRLGRSDLARQHFEMALALEPDAADIAYNLALTLIGAGQDRAAIAPLQRAAAGTDARVAAAARRNLIRIEARLTAPVPGPLPAAAPPVPAGPRIDLASSGEAVLVLAPSVAPAAAAAPVRMAAAAPALAERLGDVAALTIPINLPKPEPEAPDVLPAAVHHAPPSPPIRLATDVAPPPAPARHDAPALPLADRPVLPPRQAPLLTVQRQPMAPLVQAQWRRAEPADIVRKVLDPRQPAPPPLHDDGKAAIRLAIARLEALISLIEVQRG